MRNAQLLPRWLVAWHSWHNLLAYEHVVANSLYLNLVDADKTVSLLLYPSVHSTTLLLTTASAVHSPTRSTNSYPYSIHLPTPLLVSRERRSLPYPRHSPTLFIPLLHPFPCTTQSPIFKAFFTLPKSPRVRPAGGMTYITYYFRWSRWPSPDAPSKKIF